MRRVLVALALIVIILGGVFHRQVVVGSKTFLLIFQVFPQIPIKPLQWVSRAPDHQHVTFESTHGPVVADLFLPRPLLGTVQPHSEPAIIVAQGVKIPPGARSGFLNLGAGLARLGYVVLFPQLRSLAEGHTGLEYPDTYVRSFTYLEHLLPVDPRRISYVGLSVGSSIALVAAADPRINHRVHGMVFFAGYYDVFDYLVSVATGEDPYRGHLVRWQPSASAIRQTKHIVEDKGARGLLRIFQAHTVSEAQRILREVSPRDVERMQRYNPATHIDHYQAPTFILDDTGDTFVPYVESEKLAQTLPRSQLRAFLLTHVFHHVMPGPGGLPRLAHGFFGIYGFIYNALSSL